MRLLLAEGDDTEANVVRRNWLVNLGSTFNLLPNTTSTSSSNQNICLTISPFPAPTYTITTQMPSTCNHNQVMIIPPITTTPFEEDKQKQLAICPYKRLEKSTQQICRENLEKELCDLKKAIGEELQSRNYQSLRYEDLCLQPDVELPPGYQVPKFNTFHGKGNPLAHLKDYCSRLLGIGHNEAIRMKLLLFIQSLSGPALVWYTKQDFSKWRTWDDMANDFIRKYEFNQGVDPDMHSLYKIKKMPQESFQDYAIRWRVEATKVHPPLSEKELISIFIDIQNGIYYEKLAIANLRNFSNLIRVGDFLESGIKEGKVSMQINHALQPEMLESWKGKEKENSSVTMTMHQPQCHHDLQLLQNHAISNARNMHFQPPRQQSIQHQHRQAQVTSRQLKKRKPRDFTPLTESISSILARLNASGIMQPRKGRIFNPSHPLFDPSKYCAYHSNSQGHDTEECLALKHKIQNMIDANKLQVHLPVGTNMSNATRRNTSITPSVGHILAILEHYMLSQGSASSQKSQSSCTAKDEAKQAQIKL
ncbi:hypothetical protein A4A49_63800 [Nicotiana attenuata]|uniref:Retrotransposon gag domain-containing protein n=1 Tax=Nicotiana attenuata TaxID=49451 RepID=A0A314KRP7_NICAT|nr:hypothetical protein A4A49_63800 [Nicotiana attenuata]